MIEFPGRFVGKFIPFPREEKKIEIPKIIYRIEEYEKLSKKAKYRLEWIRKYKKCKNVSKVCRYYMISRKTFYKWYKRYKIFGLAGLEDRKRTPHRKK